MSKPSTGESSSPYTKIKGLYYTYTQVSFSSKAGFFSGLKTDSPQNLNQAFLAVFTAISHLEKYQSRPVRLTENAYLII